VRNFRFLNPVDPIPPKEIAIELPELQGGENPPRKGGEGGDTDTDTRSVIPKKRTASNEDSDLDPEEPCRTRGIRPDYKFMNDPFPDKEEAGIVEV